MHKRRQLQPADGAFILLAGHNAIAKPEHHNIESGEHAHCVKESVAHAIIMQLSNLPAVWHKFWKNESPSWWATQADLELQTTGEIFARFYPRLLRKGEIKFLKDDVLPYLRRS